MDAEALAACRSYEDLMGWRDEAYSILADRVAAVRAEISDLAGENRLARRRARSFAGDVETMERQWRQRIERLFEKLTKGFDPEIGTTKAVQEEVADELEAIFG